MYCIARRCVLPSLTQEQRDRLLAEAALHSLDEVLEAVPDPRGKQGLRYDLPFLLTCLIAALLCNCDGTEAVAQWCRDHVALLQDVFGPRLFLRPSGSRAGAWPLGSSDNCGSLRRTSRVGWQSTLGGQIRGASRSPSAPLCNSSEPGNLLPGPRG